MANRFEVPTDQRDLPRAARQFPFRWLDDRERDDVRRDADRLIEKVGGYIYTLARKYGPPGLSSDDLDDLYQDLRLSLWEITLPKYDAWRKPFTKPESFCYRCIFTKVLEIKRRANRKWQIKIGSFDPQKTNVVDPQTPEGRHVETLITELTDDPLVLDYRAGYLLRDAPHGSKLIEQARHLDLFPTTVSDLKRTMRLKAVELLDDHV